LDPLQLWLDLQQELLGLRVFQLLLLMWLR